MDGNIRKALDALLIAPSNRKILSRARRLGKTRKTPVLALAARLFVAGAFVIGQPVIAEPTPDTSVRVSDAFAALQDFVQTQRVVSLNLLQPTSGELASQARDPYSVLSDFVRVADASGWVPPVQAQGAAPDDAIHAGLRASSASADHSGLAMTPVPAQGAAPDDAIHARLRASASGEGASAAPATFAQINGASGATAPDDAIHAGLKSAAKTGSDDYSALRDFVQSMDASAPNLAIADASVSAAKPLVSAGSQTAAAESNLVVAQAAKPVKTKKPSPAADQDAYAKNDPQVCLGCHGQDRHVVGFLKSPMAAKGDPKTPMASGGCESCHGPSAAHVASRSKGGDVEPAVVFDGPHAAPVEDLNAICLGCHQTAERINWQGSLMQRQGVACVNCHTIMASEDPVRVKKTQPEVCFGCHAEQRAQSFLYSHHPVREGLVACSDCHNPHGSPGPHAVKEFTVNETCYNCHADKRGPMLWEHQPVREDCTNCHTPHGSTEQRLMKENMGFMCSSCHSAVSNNSGGAFGGGHAMLGNLQGKAIFNSALANQRLCLNCHSQIHGSNSPNGAYFFR